MALAKFAGAGLVDVVGQIGLFASREVFEGHGSLKIMACVVDVTGCSAPLEAKGAVAEMNHEALASSDSVAKPLCVVTGCIQ